MLTSSLPMMPASRIAAPLFSDFIADAPDENARMVAIAQHHVFKIAFVPLIPVKMIVKFRLLFLPHVKGFVHDNEAHPVCEFEQLGRRRIVRSANAIDSHRFQHLQLTLQRARVDGGAQRAQVVVIADAAESLPACR